MFYMIGYRSLLTVCILLLYFHVFKIVGVLFELKSIYHPWDYACWFHKWTWIDTLIIIIYIFECWKVWSHFVYQYIYILFDEKRKQLHKSQ
jgi:hypothetical protein